MDWNIGKKEKKTTFIREKAFYSVHKIQRQNDGLWVCTQVETENIEIQHKASRSTLSFAVSNQKERSKNPGITYVQNSKPFAILRHVLKDPVVKHY